MDENDRLSAAQPLYGVFERAIASNNVETMKAAAEQLRKLAGTNPKVGEALQKLEAAIAGMSGRQ